MFNFIFRYLTFRASHSELSRLEKSHLIIGLIGTWLVGMGRYWDHPNAEILQYLGMGSVAYVFCLSAVFWVTLKGLNVSECRYIHLLTLISLTSFPAALYAIPVERFMTIQSAIDVNVWFLLIVAVWRVALFFLYLSRSYTLNKSLTLLVMLLPLMAIVSSLFMLNLENAVFELMAGMHGQRSDPTPNDGAYAIVFSLTALSYIGFIPVLIMYIIAAIFRWRKKPEGESLESL